jgi:hypothetical protein
MERKSVKFSSNLKSVGYNIDTGELDIEFLSGSIYRYVMVTPEEYEELLKRGNTEGGHAGRYFAQEIRPKHKFTKVEEEG